MRLATTILLSCGLLIPAVAQDQAGRANPPVPVSGDLRAVSTCPRAAHGRRSLGRGLEAF